MMLDVWNTLQDRPPTQEEFAKPIELQNFSVCALCFVLFFKKEHEVERVELATLLNGYRVSSLDNFGTAVTITKT